MYVLFYIILYNVFDTDMYIFLYRDLYMKDYTELYRNSYKKIDTELNRKQYTEFYIYLPQKKSVGRGRLFIFLGRRPPVPPRPWRILGMFKSCAFSAFSPSLRFWLCPGCSLLFVDSNSFKI